MPLDLGKRKRPNTGRVKTVAIQGPHPCSDADEG
jgi:hypothetical protein